MTPHPWDRQRDEQGNLESMLWFGRFTLYRNMGIERSLLGAVKKTRKVRKGQANDYVPGAWRAAAKKWKWSDRAESYDLSEMERRETEYKTACDAWAKDRFEFASIARGKLDTLMSFPVTRQTKASNDGNTYIIEPLSAKEIKDVIVAYKGIDELARTTTRETLPKTQLEIKDWRQIAREQGIDPDAIYSELVQEFAAAMVQPGGAGSVGTSKENSGKA